MNSTLRKLDEFHKTKTGLLVFGFVELGVAYLYGSLALDSGSLWEWALAIIFLIGGLLNLVKIFLVRKK